jgi:hypothetical protein
MPGNRCTLAELRKMQNRKDADMGAHRRMKPPILWWAVYWVIVGGAIIALGFMVFTLRGTVVTAP